MSGLIWLALDGVGHPQGTPADTPEKTDSPERSSVWEQDLPTLRPLIDSGVSVDATFGVEGLPQSGTGQSSWLTGQNALLAMPQREHFGPHASPSLQALLRGRGLPVRLVQQGRRVALLNEYPAAYFAAQAQRPRYGCFPYSVLAAGLPLNPPEVPHLDALLGLHYAAPEQPPKLSYSDLAAQGERLAHAATYYDLLMADLWFSDHIGHLGAPGMAVSAAPYQAGRLYLRQLDALLEGLLQAGAQVVISADHGNLEDLQTKMHTRARVPFASNALPITTHTARTIAQAGAQIAQYLGLEPEAEATS